MGTQRTFQLGPVKVRVTTPDAEGVAGTAEAKERLTRDRIVDVALAQMAERGYDAVSMRSIAKQLGTGPASLYAHVPSKDALDQLVVDRIAATMTVPAPDPERWAEQVKAHLVSGLEAYRAHPGSGRAALATIPTEAGALAVAEGLMAILLAGDIHPQAAAWFADLAALYVSAIAAEESIWVDRAKAAAAGGLPVTEQEVIRQLRDLYAALPPEVYPTLTAYADTMTAGGSEERFEFGLDVLLAGLEVVSERMKRAD